MSELLEKQYLVKLGVMGGEPLLHPDLLEILKAARKLFPATQIRLTTNGILLLQQNDEFWNVCRENKITIVITKYPLDLKYEEIKAKIKNENVLFHFFEGTGEGIVKKSFKRKINLEGGSNPVEMFANCDLANYGNFLMEGKLYGCPFSCQMNRIFNDIFAQEIPLTEKDFLDIYKVNGMDEVMKFASKARPMCRFCSGVQDFCDWERSRGEISEWI
jgi:MoaA/NifB/PqqE/SkfB family radical SAM enzyme